MAPVYRESGGRDGFVSLEIPRQASERRKSFRFTRHLIQGVSHARIQIRPIKTLPVLGCQRHIDAVFA